MSNTLNQIHDVIDAIVDPEPQFTDYDSDDDYSYESSSSGSSDDYLTAQQHWEESMDQIRGLFNLVLFPLVGKVIGRRTAHIVWAKVADWWFI